MLYSYFSTPHVFFILYKCMGICACVGGLLTKFKTKSTMVIFVYYGSNINKICLLSTKIYNIVYLKLELSSYFI